MNNKRSLTINFVTSTTLAVIFGTAMTTTNSAWAADITCPRGSTPSNPCLGTNDPDNMQGTSEADVMMGLAGGDKMFGFASNDQMFGNNGDDTMSGGSGRDDMHGNERNDNVNGDSGDDIIRGGFGADTLKGSSGNDRTFHGFEQQGAQSDNNKDNIDCGSGIDEAWINTSTDGDTAVNCETVHAG